MSKLGVMVQSLSWNSEVNILAGAQDSMLTVWLFPTALYIDKSILRRTTLFKDLRYGIYIARLVERLSHGII